MEPQFLLILVKEYNREVFGQTLDQGSAFACLLKSVVETNRSNWALEHKGVKNLQWTHASSFFPSIIEREQRKYEHHFLRASTLNLLNAWKGNEIGFTTPEHPVFIIALVDTSD